MVERFDLVQYEHFDQLDRAFNGDCLFQPENKKPPTTLGQPAANGGVSPVSRQVAHPPGMGWIGSAASQQAHDGVPPIGKEANDGARYGGRRYADDEQRALPLRLPELHLVGDSLCVGDRDFQRGHVGFDFANLVGDFLDALVNRRAMFGGLVARIERILVGPVYLLAKVLTSALSSPIASEMSSSFVSMPALPECTAR